MFLVFDLVFILFKNYKPKTHDQRSDLGRPWMTRHLILHLHQTIRGAHLKRSRRPSRSHSPSQSADRSKSRHRSKRKDKDRDGDKSETRKEAQEAQRQGTEEGQGQGRTQECVNWQEVRTSLFIRMVTNTWFG